MKTKLLLLPLLVCGLSSCSIKKEDKVKLFLNYDYRLIRAGDLHGISPLSKDVLTQNKGFTSYISLFDTKRSHINFQCDGSSFDEVHCDTTFALYDKNGNCIFGSDDETFRTSYVGNQMGKVKFEDKETGNKFGTIYVSTPYWCRWQFEYDVDGSGEKTLLTFEFVKKTFNPLPDWSK